ncbi:MAG: hypothetical protein Q4G13_02945, partial [Moraxella sp.]|nr:hypothetical protein [Moraxella sp.]
IHQIVIHIIAGYQPYFLTAVLHTSINQHHITTPHATKSHKKPQHQSIGTGGGELLSSAQNKRLRCQAHLLYYLYYLRSLS